MTSMDDMLKGSALDGGQAEQQEPQVETQAEPQQDAEQQEQGETTAPKQHTTVPLSALEAVRGEKNDWKGKWERSDAELQLLRKQMAQGQSQHQMDPLQSMQQQLINERFNTSEMIVRSQHKDADEKIEAFKEAARANPALGAMLTQQNHPWEFAYKEGARLLMQREMGDDPAAYRAKLEAEIRASLQGESSPAAKIPQSLNGVRSAAPRSAGAWTGPPDFNQLVGR